MAQFCPLIAERTKDGLTVIDIASQEFSFSMILLQVRQQAHARERSAKSREGLGTYVVNEHRKIVGESPEPLSITRSPSANFIDLKALTGNERLNG